MAAVPAGPTRVVEIEGADHNDCAPLDGAPLIAAIADLADWCAPPPR